MNILQVLSTALRIDPEQRFTCASCARCCRRHEIVVTPDEVESLRRRDAGQWFRAAYDAPAGAHDDPFTPLDDGRGYHLVRKGAEGACGFLSPTNRCRLHEELGADAYIYGTTEVGGERKPVIARVDGRTPPAKGAVLHLAPRAGALHMFAGDSGARIDV